MTNATSMIEPQLSTLAEFIEAAEAIRAFGPPMKSTLELTQDEFERLKKLCEPHMRASAIGAPPMFLGLSIEVREP